MYYVYAVIPSTKDVRLIDRRKTVEECKALIEDLRADNQHDKRSGKIVFTTWYIITDEYGEQVEE